MSDQDFTTTGFSTFTIDSSDPNLSGEWYAKEEVDKRVFALERERDSIQNRYDSLAQHEKVLHARIDVLETLLQRLKVWDHMQVAADGPYWIREIDQALEAET